MPRLPTLHVAFLWHMHQPSYVDPESGDVLLPWVRLHAAKDYTDMATALASVPAARMTVNWVPGLLDQLAATAAPDALSRDRFARLTLTPAADLTPDAIATLRRDFFSLPFATLIAPSPRYRALHARVAQSAPLTLTELRDLQLHFNLGWTGFTLRQLPEINHLVQKDSNFTETDKAALLAAHTAAAAAVPSRWQALAAAGQAELTTSPYYHPITPLLIDTTLARAAAPHTPLPTRHLQAPSDASAHLTRAVSSHRRRFGTAPRGLWPSEGAVAEPLLPLIHAAGLRWLVTDEALLTRTLAQAAQPIPPLAHLRPWARAGLSLFFRDHALSDAIGFAYARQPTATAIADFVHRLRALHAAHTRQAPDRDAVVVIALDGENCWEHYPGGIMEFLPRLLNQISQTPRLHLATLSEAEAAVPTSPLPELAAGSWIDGNFRTWLGDPVKNAAWDHLITAREAAADALPHAVTHTPPTSTPPASTSPTTTPGTATSPTTTPGTSTSSTTTPGTATSPTTTPGTVTSPTTTPGTDAPPPPPTSPHPPGSWDRIAAHNPTLAELLLQAEASDWWWWFGAGHSSTFDATFDALFRAHLRKIWSLLGRPHPPALDHPITPPATVAGVSPPRCHFAPRIDGSTTSYFKWSGAGHLPRPSGATHRAATRLLAADYAHDAATLSLRFQLAPGTLDRARLELIATSSNAPPRTVTLWPPAPPVTAALGTTFECALPLSLLGVTSLAACVGVHFELHSCDEAGSSQLSERFPDSDSLDLRLLSAREAALNTLI